MNEYSAAGQPCNDIEFKHRRWLDIVFVVVIVLLALAGMQHFEQRLATLHQDDGPILYAYAFKNPQAWQGDYQVGSPLAERVNFKVTTSAMYLVPALFWKYLDVPPQPFAWAISFYQVVGLGLSVYLLALAMGLRQHVALLAALFVYAASPWHWNPANYGGGYFALWVPYPALGAVPAILASWACLLWGRRGMALVLLLLGGACHPPLGLLACGLALFYELLADYQQRQWRWWRWIGPLLLAAALLLPPMLLRNLIARETVDFSELMAGLRANQHVWPINYSGRWPLSLLTCGWMLVLAVLGWRWKDELVAGYGRLWGAAVLVAVAGSLVHVLGILTRSPLLLTLIGFRAWTWLSLLSAPLIVLYLWRKTIGPSPLGSAAAGLSLLMPFVAAEYGIVGLLVLALLADELADGRLSWRRVSLSPRVRRVLYGVGCLAVIAWCVMFLGLPWLQSLLPAVPWKYLAWFVLGSLPILPVRLALVAVGGLFAARPAIQRWWQQRGKNLRRFQFAQLVAMWTCLTVGLFGVLAYRSRIVFDEEIEAYLAVQKWANADTPPDAMFLVTQDGWRSIALRRKVSPWTRDAYAYVVAPATVKYRRRVLEAYGFSPEQQARRGLAMKKLQRSRYETMDAKSLHRFARELGATHLVLPADRDMPGLDPVYSNVRFAVYELPEAVDDSSQSSVITGNGPRM